MSSDGTKIELVYEPGFGETGPQKPEDLVMVERPVGIYNLTDKRKGEYQKILDDAGIEMEPMNLLLFSETNKEQRSEQAYSAITRAILENMQDNNFPKVTTPKPLGDMSFSVIESSPLKIVRLTSNFSLPESKSGTKVPLQNILICKTNGATDAEYNRARKIIFDDANRTLQLFNADFRIPHASADAKLTTI